MAALFRIIILIVAGFGAYKFYPKIKPEIQQAIQNPQVLGSQTVAPIINTLNQILPDNIQLPTPKKSESPSSSTSATNSSQPTPSALSGIVDSVKDKATDIAAEQVENLKKEAGKAFCQALVEKIKTECGQ